MDKFFTLFGKIILIVGVLALLIGGGFYLGKIFQNKNNSNNNVSVTPPKAVVFGQKLYTNPGFGISFLYATESDGEKYDVKEEGNKIYVYDTKYPYIQGQYMEVFQKSETANLTQAIKKEFLQGISPNDCFVKNVADILVDYPSGLKSGFEVKTLGFPLNPNLNIPEFAQENKCPKGYAETNGISYFLGDSAHPKIFLFLSIGQYRIPSAPNSDKAWQDTIRFL